jgi:hypothetical protein
MIRNLLASGVVALAVAGLIAAPNVLIAPPPAHASPGCETIPWGFLGSQKRTLCDGPMLPDGSWERGRVVWVPAHQVPFTCTYGRYSSTCSGGYFVNETTISQESYFVRPETVLPDEPGYLGCSICGASSAF